MSHENLTDKDLAEKLEAASAPEPAALFGCTRCMRFQTREHEARQLMLEAGRRLRRQRK